QQPVLGQTRDAQQRTKQRCRHDANDRDAQCIDDSYPDRPAIGIGRLVGDQALADGKASLPVEKAKAGRDVAHCKIVQRIGNQIPDSNTDEAQHQYLIDKRAKARIVPGKTPSGTRHSYVIRHRNYLPEKTAFASSVSAEPKAAPGHKTRRAGEPAGSGSAYRPTVHHTALFPLCIKPTLQFHRRILSDVALERLAIVANLLDKVVAPFLIQAQSLAHFTGNAQDALDIGIGAL